MKDEEVNGSQPSAGLGDVRVVEVSRAVEGAYCARLLADAGAEVIKIESPDDIDSVRRLGPFPHDDMDPERSGLYVYLNANKRGMTLNLETATGRDILSDLVARSDVLITDYPLAIVEELGLTYDSLREVNPQLIACAITAFGMTGPWRNLRGDDIVSLSVGGLTAATPGFPDYVKSREDEGPLRPETFAAGFISGATGAVAVLEALFARLMDGDGRQVDVSQQEAVASTMVRDIASYSYAGIVSGRRTEAEQSGTAYAPNIYLPCKDGMVVIITASEALWERFVEVMGTPEWTRDEMFRDSPSRARNINHLVPRLIEWTMTMTGEEITRLTQANGLPFAHVLNIPQLADSAHARERGVLMEVDIGNQRCRAPGPPFRIEGVFGDTRRAAPRRGEHNRDILCGWLGRPEVDLPRLRALGVI